MEGKTAAQSGRNGGNRLRKEFGCSGCTWETENGRHLMGRTYDQFGSLDDNKIAVIPRSSRLRLEISPESQSYADVRYAYAGMAVLGLDTPIMVDGINEKGLMGALLNFPGYADYSAQQNGAGRRIHPGFLITCLLGECGSVEDVVKQLAQIRLTEELIFGHTMSVHYMFSDASGETVIVEPDRDGLTVHRQTIGVMTNSPGYEWHLTNLSNYMGVTNLPRESRQIGGKQISVFGERQGGSMGLPGDYTSPSRFVRMTFMKEYAVRGKDELDGVSRMFHLFSTVDIPEGIIKAGEAVEDYEQTLCTSAMCAESRTYYFATAKNRRISAVRLDRELANPEIRYYDLPQKEDIQYLNE